MKQSPSWEADDHSPSREIPYFLWHPNFITVFTRAGHRILSWVRLIQSASSHPVSLRSILKSFQLCLGLLSGLLPSGFQTKIVYAFLVSPIFLHLITLMILGEAKKLRSSRLCSCYSWVTITVKNFPQYWIHIWHLVTY